MSTTSALALLVITFILGVGFTIMFYNIQAISAQSSSSTTTTGTVAEQVAASINQKPAVMALKIDWCNTDNTGEDRFCPAMIDVVQGDIVQILFIQNDTDTHTFTLTSGPYSFQINTTMAGSHNFLDNETAYNGSCVNGNYSEESAGVSTTYCVSGSSLLSPTFLAANGASNFAEEQNGNPAEPFGSSTNPHPIVLPISDDSYYGDSSNLTGVNIPSNATSSEVWGVGAFQASYAGVYQFTCIYHVANGMFGYLVVLPNAYWDTNATACGLS
ncbi:MAG TPA: hypothetical protein VED17_07110 [Nitrososphaerales archaeon]|nr:hypothetical protein [Nitrososphaerales archaeon]